MQLPWSDIDAIRAEWPAMQFNPVADLESWRQGMRLYEADGYPSMMRAATLLSAALAHNLYGDGILKGSDLPETVNNVLYASVEAPPDGHTFAQGARRCARLALTIVREYGWQPTSMGGKGRFDQLIEGSYMLFATAIAGPGQSAGDLNAFFAVPPQPVIEQIRDSQAGSSAVNAMFEMIDKAEDGDEVSQLHARGMALWMQRDLPAALAALEEAARRGDVRAMKDAGDLADDMGDDGRTTFWYEAAAKAGNPQAIYNMGVIAIRTGDPATAAMLFQRAAAAGNPDGYAALASYAAERGDPAADRHWARLGAEAGHTFCMRRHGAHLAEDSNGDAGMLRRAAAFLEESAKRGDVVGMTMAGNVNIALGNQQQAQTWFDRARSTGDPQALAMLEKYGH